MPNNESFFDPTDLAMFASNRASVPLMSLLYSKEANAGQDYDRFTQQRAYERAMAERRRDAAVQRAMALRQQQELDARVPPEVQRWYMNSRYDPDTATRRADYETPPTRNFGSPGTEMRATPRGFQKGGKVAKTIREMADELLAGSVKIPNSATGTGKSNALSTVRREIAPQVEAMLLAQRRASLPISEGGLGLPAGNTPEQRATLMGFVKDRYHGSVSDIKKLDAGRTSDLGYYGKGIYSTDSPKDASNNYAKIIGPDVEDKVNRAISGWSADRINDFKRKTRGATPSQLEALIYDALGADNYGVVYPLKVRSDKSISLNKRGKQPLMVDANSDAFRGALSRLGELGGDIPRIEKSIAELGNGDSVLARDMFNLIDEGVGRSALVDPQSRKIISNPQAASDFVKQLGVDEINHRPQFGSSRLDIGKEHTISLDPDNVRSRFAAFDPFRRNAAIAAAMGVEAPDLLAEEQKKEGGAVQRFQKGGGVRKTVQQMADELLAKGTRTAAKDAPDIGRRALFGLRPQQDLPLARIHPDIEKAAESRMSKALSPGKPGEPYISEEFAASLKAKGQWTPRDEKIFGPQLSRRALLTGAAGQAVRRMIPGLDSLIPSASDVVPELKGALRTVAGPDSALSISEILPGLIAKYTKPTESGHWSGVDEGAVIKELGERGYSDPSQYKGLLNDYNFVDPESEMDWASLGALKRPFEHYQSIIDPRGEIAGRTGFDQSRNPLSYRPAMRQMREANPDLYKETLDSARQLTNNDIETVLENMRYGERSKKAKDVYKSLDEWRKNKMSAQDLENKFPDFVDE